MLKKYVHKSTGTTLLINEKDINRSVHIKDMLMVPNRQYVFICDRNINFIKDEYIEESKVKQYLFLDKNDLTEDLKKLYIQYKGFLSPFIKDKYSTETFDESMEDEIVHVLEGQLKSCIKQHSVKPNQFLYLEMFENVILYDPEISQYKEEWAYTKEAI